MIGLKKRMTNRIVSCLSVAAMLIASMAIFPQSVFAGADKPDVDGDGTLEVNEAYANHESLQPLPMGFQVDTLLQWTPEKDPDARYARSTIPLNKNRVTGPLVNEYANPDAKMMVCTLSNANHDGSPVQGGEVFDSYAFTYWQYVDTMVYWAGSSEGIFVVPTPDMIDSAHKNGVPITATLGFPWGSDTTEGQIRIEEVRKFVQKDANGNFPVADKMVEVADYYGFDGYFFNQETYGCTQQMALDMAEMMKYVKQKRPDIIFNWYDSVINTGNVSYQDSVNESNKMWIEADENGLYAADQFFMNYNWGGTHNAPDSADITYKIDGTIDTMKKYGRSQYDAFAGLELQGNSLNTPIRDYLLVDPVTQKLKISLALYCPNSTMGFAKDPVDFHEWEKRFYVTSTGDPRDEPLDPTIKENREWVGMARFFADKTVITSAPFVTNFNTGHGKQWFIDGEVSRDKEWNNRSMQDIAPTWTWMVDSNGAKLEGDYDFDDAFNGGNSIKFTGNLDSQNNIMLYSTKMNNAKKAEITYKVNQAGSKVELAVCYGDPKDTEYDTNDFKYYPLDEAAPGQWTTSTVSLDTGNISAIGLRVDGEIQDYQLNVGRIAFIGADIAPLNAPASVTLDEIMYNSASEAQVRMYWSPVSGASSYELYRVAKDGSEEFINATPNSAFFIPTLKHEEGQKEVKVKVVPVNKNGIRGNSKTLTIDWKMDEDATEDEVQLTSVNVALNAKVTGYSKQEAAEPANKALDGTSLNGSKWCAAGTNRGWMSIDLGAPKTIKRWRVEHAQAGGEGKINNTRDFSLQYKDADGNWQIAKAITYNTDAITDVLLDEPEGITAQEWKLDITYADRGQWTAIRIFEWQMFEEGVLPPTKNIPMNYASAVNNEGATDIFKLEKVPYEYTVNLYKNITDTEPFATKQAMVEPAPGQDPPQTMTVEFTDLDLGKEAGKVYYTLISSFSTESNKLSVTYDAETADVSTTIVAENVNIVKYDATKPVARAITIDNRVPTTVFVKGLQQGDVVYVYEADLENTDVPAPVYAKKSAPMVKGQTTAFIDGIRTNVGSKIWVQVKSEGKKPSANTEITVSEIDDTDKLVMLNEGAQFVKGETVVLMAKVVNYDGASQDVKWEIEGVPTEDSQTIRAATGAKTVLRGNVLTIDIDEQMTSFEVKATSVSNPSLSVTSTVEVIQGSRPLPPQPSTPSPSVPNIPTPEYSQTGSSTEVKAPTMVTGKGDTLEVSIPEIDTTGATVEKPVEVTMELDAHVLGSNFESMSGTTLKVDIIVPDSISKNDNAKITEMKAPKEMFEKSKALGKDLQFEIKSEDGKIIAKWVFAHKTMKAIDTNLALNIDFAINQFSMEASVADQVRGTVVTFSHSGELPSKAKVSVATGNLYSNGDKLFLYYFNEATGNFELKAKDITVANGFATFEIDHCSSYVLSKVEIKKSATTETGKLGKIEIVKSTETTTNPPVTTNNPQTGDMNDLSFAVVLAFAGIALAVLSKKFRTQK